MNNQLSNTNPIIAEALKNFFNDADISEFIKRNQSLFKGEDSGEKAKTDFELKSSPITRTQVDILITFGETKFTAERYLEFLIYLGQLIITAGEYSTALDIFEKIISTIQPDIIHLTEIS